MLFFSTLVQICAVYLLQHFPHDLMTDPSHVKDDPLVRPPWMHWNHLLTLVTPPYLALMIPSELGILSGDSAPSLISQANITAAI